MDTTRRSLCLLALGAAAGILAGCGGGDDGPLPVLTVDADGISTIEAAALDTTLASYAVLPLSSAESNSLTSNRQMERLARDVMTVSASLYPQPVFDHIADSEETHAQAVKTLLDRYALPDPLAGLPAGTFATPAIQALYDDLAARSRSGLIAALKAGLEVEELSVRDLTAQQALIDNADILLVWGHLLRGSRNHLRALFKVLAAAGTTYTPVYLSPSAFTAIVSSPIEPGA